MLKNFKSRLRSFLGNAQILAELEHLENHITHLEAKVEANQQYNMPFLHELLSYQSQSKFRELITESRYGTILDCCINRTSVLIPVEVLKTYIHCLHTSSERKLEFLVEIHCSDWLAKKLRAGDTFLDIGAAFGVISLPLAEIVGSTGKIYAFEPAKQTRHLLEQIIQLNALSNIEVVSVAVSDAEGSAEFVEYDNDNTLSWASDTSTLASDIKPTHQNYSTYPIEIITIDHFVEVNHIKPDAIKIDIEGFEQYALEGAENCLRTCHPALCIDIHQDVKTKESALLTVEPFLTNLGYKCEYRQHTLFASFH